MKIRINMLSSAESVKGQGVASAFREQVTLIEEMKDDFSVEINSKSSKFDIYHIHTVDPKYRIRMNKKHLNIMYVHFVPAKNDGSLKMPKLFEWIFKKYVEKTYRKADEVIVVNPCFIPELEKIKIPREKITYIPNFVDHEKFKPIERDKISELKKVHIHIAQASARTDANDERSIVQIAKFHQQTCRQLDDRGKFVVFVVWLESA